MPSSRTSARRGSEFTLPDLEPALEVRVRTARVSALASRGYNVGGRFLGMGAPTRRVLDVFLAMSLGYVAPV